MLDHFHDVGLRGLENVEPHGRAAVEMTPPRDLGTHELDARDICDMDIVLDDEIADLVERAEFAERSHRKSFTVAGDLPRADREVALLEQHHELADIHGVGGESARIDEDAHFARLDTGELDPCHAVDALD